MTCPTLGRIAPSPRVPDPRTSRNRRVSAWSSAVWAVAIASADELNAGVLQKGIPGLPGGILDRSPFALRQRRGVHTAADEPDPEATGQSLTEREVLVGGLATQAVVQVRRSGHDHLATLLQLAKQKQHRHRIGSAGERHEHTGTGRDESVSTKRPDDAIAEGHDSGQRQRPSSHAEAIGRGPFTIGVVQRRKKWCRCRDLNPGQRGYEPRALTN